MLLVLDFSAQFYLLSFVWAWFAEIDLDWLSGFLRICLFSCVQRLARLGLVLYVLVFWTQLNLVWFGLAWFGWNWFGLIQWVLANPLTFTICQLSCVQGFSWFGLVWGWLGLQKNGFDWSIGFLSTLTFTICRQLSCVRKDFPGLALVHNWSWLCLHKLVLSIGFFWTLTSTICLFSSVLGLFWSWLGLQKLLSWGQENKLASSKLR